MTGLLFLLKCIFFSEISYRRCHILSCQDCLVLLCRKSDGLSRMWLWWEVSLLYILKQLHFILKKVPTVGLSNCSHYQHTNSNTTASIFLACLIGGLKSITDAPDCTTLPNDKSGWKWKVILICPSVQRTQNMRKLELLRHFCKISLLTPLLSPTAGYVGAHLKLIWGL